MGFSQSKCKVQSRSSDSTELLAAHSLVSDTDFPPSYGGLGRNCAPTTASNDSPGGSSNVEMTTDDEKERPAVEPEETLWITVEGEKRAELQAKVAQLASCARAHRYEVEGLFEAAFGDYHISSDGLRMKDEMSRWNDMAFYLTITRSILRTRCRIKTIGRFEKVQAQCVEVFRDYDTWIQASYDLIESEGVDTPTKASAQHLRAKIMPTADALCARLAPLNGRMEMILRDLFEKWR